MGLVGFLPFFGWNSGIFEGKCDFRIVFDFNYIIFLCVFGSFLPTIVFIIVYVFIYREIRVQVRNEIDFDVELIRTFFSRRSVRR